MIGGYSLAVFLGSVVSGRLGSLYERWPASEFWVLHAALVGFGGVLVLAFGTLMKPALNRTGGVGMGRAEATATAEL